ncbi:helix-turn-helix domain-containing protein [Rhizobium mongolense]|uniref:helix-turn-helix domain-containing protein n=1 Tax=Rhizobium mongolense TaxID=57676 RepID=UPI001F421DE6|nr:helix-turn-helix domain-containing protein [Rhizobium mongolense]
MIDQTDPSPLLTPAAAAKILAVSVKQLTHLTLAGEIPFVNIGLGNKRPTRRYLPTDIDEFIARRRTTAMPLVLKQQIKSAASATYEIIDIEKRLADLRAARQRARACRPGKS